MPNLRDEEQTTFFHSASALAPWALAAVVARECRSTSLLPAYHSM